MVVSDLDEPRDVVEQELLSGVVAVPLHEATIVRVAGPGHSNLITVVDERGAARRQQNRKGIAQSLVRAGAGRHARKIRPRAVLAVRPLVVPKRHVFGEVNASRDVVVADEGAHDRRTVEPVVAIHERRELLHRPLPHQDRSRHFHSERKVELAIQHVGVDVVRDGVAVAGERLTDHVEVVSGLGLDLRGDPRAHLQKPRVLDVLDRIEPKAVRPGVSDPLQRVVHGVVHRRLLGKVEVRQVVGKPAPLARLSVPTAPVATYTIPPRAVVVRPKPPGVVAEHSRRAVHVVHRVVEDHLEAPLVRGIDELLKLSQGTEMFLGRFEIAGPVVSHLSNLPEV